MTNKYLVLAADDYDLVQDAKFHLDKDGDSTEEEKKQSVDNLLSISLKYDVPISPLMGYQIKEEDAFIYPMDMD